MNALKAMVPDFDPDEQKEPRGSVDLGDGYSLRRARDESPHHLDGDAGRVIEEFLEENNGPMTGSLGVVRWARLSLPNGQIARSLWKESRRPLNKLRTSRNVKVRPSLCFIALILT
jgi:hypothetical protein